MIKPRSITVGGSHFVRSSDNYSAARKALSEIADSADADIRERSGASAADGWISQLRTKMNGLSEDYPGLSEAELDSLVKYTVRRIERLPLMADDPARPGVIHRDVRPEPVTRREPLPEYPPMRTRTRLVSYSEGL